jgi:hypothetical protein
VSSVSNGSVLPNSTASQRHARYLYIKRNVEKVWGARYLSKNTVICVLFKFFSINDTQNFQMKMVKP